MQPLLNWSFVLLLAVGLWPARAQNEPAVTNAPPAVPAARVASAPSFDKYRLIVERNVFNQSRSPRTASARMAPPPKAAPKVYSFALVGTMSYAKGDFAFFEGSSPEYRKTVKAGGTIAGYEVKEVTPSWVKVANEKQEFEMQVGQQLRREGDGEWRLAASSRPASSAEPSGGGSGGGTVSEEEALRRMMEKRAKELN